MRSLVFVIPSLRWTESRGEPCVSFFFLSFFFLARRRGWTFRATKKDTLSAAGSPRNTLEFRPPARSIESACFSSSGKTILPSCYCWSGNCSGVRRDLAYPRAPLLSLSLSLSLAVSAPRVTGKRNFFPCIRRVSRKARFKFGFALFVTDSPRKNACKAVSLRELSNWPVHVDLSRSSHC